MPVNLASPSFIEIPLDWSPDQALAVHETLSALREHLWICYSLEIQHAMRLQQAAAPCLPATDLDEADVPF